MKVVTLHLPFKVTAEPGTPAVLPRLTMRQQELEGREVVDSETALRIQKGPGSRVAAAVPASEVSAQVESREQRTKMGERGEAEGARAFPS
jgi:hypothetical protein